MKIAIIGTVGIPANYGGFETLTEFLTKHLRNISTITVFCSTKNGEKLKEFNGAELKYIPLNANGIQSIPYDIISLFKAARKNDSILILGVSGCIILPLFKLFYSNKHLVINIDGLEHRREKWKKPIQKFLRYSEKLAVKYANEVIADNKAIQDYILQEYNKSSNLIAYGGNHTFPCKLEKGTVKKYDLPKKYAFKVCRIEPENNIKMVLKAFKNSSFPLVMVGNWDYSDYGKELKKKYSAFSNLLLLDAIYDQQILNQIRSNCSIYIHGHSAGGTNPSLVEAMSLGLPVFAYNVEYNKETTYNKAKYFKNSEELKKLIKETSEEELRKLGEEMNSIAEEHYTWEKISKQYYELF